MNKYLSGNVIVPWDFSNMSKGTLKETLEMVDSSETIQLIHVTPYPSVSDYSTLWGVLSEADIRANHQELFAKEMEKGDFPELKLHLEFGDPGTQIAKFATAENASLIVVSSHGNTGLSRLLLGSVAERIVRLAPCPVLVLRGILEDV